MRHEEGGGQGANGFNVIDWLLGLIQGTQPKKNPGINGAMLDHLAALEAYDSAEALRYRGELAERMTPQWKQHVAPFLLVNYGAGGWGRERSARLAHMLGVTEGVARD